MGVPEFEAILPEGDGPILFGHPYNNPSTPLESIAGVPVKHLGELVQEGVGIYVRSEVYE